MPILTLTVWVGSLVRCFIITFRNLSALAHWAPILAETSFLPHLAFPFLKFFENTPVSKLGGVRLVITSCVLVLD